MQQFTPSAHAQILQSGHALLTRFVCQERSGNAPSTHYPYEDLLPRGLRGSHALCLSHHPNQQEQPFPRWDAPIGPQERAGDQGEGGRMTTRLSQNPQPPGSSHSMRRPAAHLASAGSPQPSVSQGHLNHEDEQLIDGTYPITFQQANRGTSRCAMTPTKHDRAPLCKSHTLAGLRFGTF